MIQGSCLCGSVAFEATDAIEFRYCHCSRCRKSRGGAYSANIFVKPEGFRWLRGEELVITYRLRSAQRFGNAFCRECGSPAPRKVPMRDFVLIPAGALDGEAGLRPSCHIFAGSKVSWHEIADGLPQYEEYPPST